MCIRARSSHTYTFSCSNFHIVCANDLVPFSISKYVHTRWPSSLKTVCDSYVLKEVLQWDYNSKSCERSAATTLEPTFPVKFYEMNQKTVNRSASLVPPTLLHRFARENLAITGALLRITRNQHFTGFSFAQGFPL